MTHATTRMRCPPAQDQIMICVNSVCCVTRGSSRSRYSVSVREYTARPAAPARHRAVRHAGARRRADGAGLGSRASAGAGTAARRSPAAGVVNERSHQGRWSAHRASRSGAGSPPASRHEQRPHRGITGIMGPCRSRWSLRVPHSIRQTPRPRVRTQRLRSKTGTPRPSYALEDTVAASACAPHSGRWRAAWIAAPIPTETPSQYAAGRPPVLPCSRDPRCG